MAKHKQFTFEQNFSVAFDYPVLFTRDVFNPSNALLRDTLCRKDSEPRQHRVMVIVDENVAVAHPDLSRQVHKYFNTWDEDFDLVKEPHVVVGGEAVKNDYRLLMALMDVMMEYRLCRHSFVVAIGGGAVLDAVGFGTAMLHRGLRLVRLPTTVLGQNDAGVGVKNGMNLHGGKNTIGTFAPPFAVINDYSFLETLSDDDWIGGISEAFKVAIIKDREFFDTLSRNAPLLKQRDMAAMEALIERCAVLHLEHIRDNNDAFEMGSARPLDFGHWAAHKLESMTNYRLSHGHAVAIGIAVDSYYAKAKGWIEPDEYEVILYALSASGYTLWDEAMERSLGDGSLELISGIKEFQEHLGGELCVTMPQGIGKRFEIHHMETPLIKEAVTDLKSRFQSIAASL